MNWVYALITAGVCALIGALLFAALVLPIEEERDEHEDGGF